MTQARRLRLTYPSRGIRGAIKHGLGPVQRGQAGRLDQLADARIVKDAARDFERARLARLQKRGATIGGVHSRRYSEVATPPL
jgi:hypothetical protein